MFSHLKILELLRTASNSLPIPFVLVALAGLFAVKKERRSSTPAAVASIAKQQVDKKNPLPIKKLLTKLLPVKIETKTPIEPRQFAQIGTSFSGATVIPHAADTDDVYEEEEMILEELEEITFADDILVKGEDDDHDKGHTGSFSFLVNASDLATKQVRGFNESSNSSSALNDPSQIKSESENGDGFACRHCGKKYRWKSTLIRHEKVECGGRAPSYGCPYCSYKAKQRGNLSVHMRKHHSELPQLASKRKSKE